MPTNRCVSEVLPGEGADGSSLAGLESMEIAGDRE